MGEAVAGAAAFEVDVDGLVDWDGVSECEGLGDVDGSWVVFGYEAGEEGGGEYARDDWGGGGGGGGGGSVDGVCVVGEVAECVHVVLGEGVGVGEGAGGWRGVVALSLTLSFSVDGSLRGKNGAPYPRQG